MNQNLFPHISYFICAESRYRDTRRKRLALPSEELHMSTTVTLTDGGDIFVTELAAQSYGIKRVRRT